MTRRKTIQIPIETEDEGEDIMASKRASKGKAPRDADREQAMDPTPSGEEHAGGDAVDSTEVEAELNQTLDHLKRLQAEFDNYRRRTDRERLETVGWAQAQLIEQILPAIDDLDRAAQMGGDENSPVLKGFHLVTEKLHRVLEEAGLERIPAVGNLFDPNLHEALLTETVEKHRAGTVLQELVVGYQYKGRVVRPSRVKVGMAGDGE